MLKNALPALTADEQQQCDQVLLHIKNSIAQQGRISFAEYMQLALYAPGLGYYSAGAQKFGADGDFVTAPEISPLFSRCVARQCQQVLTDLNGGDILEFGAGSGIMALTILQALAALDCLPTHYYILEVSADLHERQQQLFQQQAPELLSRVRWLSALPEQPIRGVILANEVIDAMPVHKFQQYQGTIKEYYVAEEQGQLQWQLAEPSVTELQPAIAALALADDLPYESEINLLMPGWIAGIADSLQAGLVLLIDYGFPAGEYYHPQRNMGTLMCHYRHHAHPDPLIYPGLQDITAHVDFTAVANAAVSSGLDVADFIHQAGFLINCGLVDMLPEIDDIAEHYKQSQAIKKLTLPSEMGELFKVLALVKDYPQPLCGFKALSQLRRL